MNRQERRAWARGGRRKGGAGFPGLGEGSCDCGCSTRLIRRVSAGPVTCPACGALSVMDAIMAPDGVMSWPTGVPVGGMVRMENGCSCGHEYAVSYEVVA